MTIVFFFHARVTTIVFPCKGDNDCKVFIFIEHIRRKKIKNDFESCILELTSYVKITFHITRRYCQILGLLSFKKRRWDQTSRNVTSTTEIETEKCIGWIGGKKRIFSSGSPACKSMYSTDVHVTNTKCGRDHWNRHNCIKISRKITLYLQVRQ